MTESLYERYRDALRGGHLAKLKGNREIARRAYLEAAALLPDRAAPYVGLGRLELEAGRPEEALTAFESALARAPDEVAALDGAATALEALDRRSEAADLLDRQAITLLEAGRDVDARAAVERALTLAESRWRRRALERLGVEAAAAEPWLTELPAGDASSREAAVAPGTPHSPAAPDTPAGAVPRPTASGAPIDPDLVELAAAVDAAGAAADIEGLVRGALALARRDRLRAAIDACHDALSLAPADASVHRALAAVYRRRGWDAASTAKLRLVDRYAEVVDDPDELDAEADQAETARDVEGLLVVAARHAERDRLDAALEVAFRALHLAPADPRVHLAIARLHLGRGWHGRAVESVGRLWRLVELGDDATARELVTAFVADELATGRNVRARTA